MTLRTRAVVLALCGLLAWSAARGAAELITEVIPLGYRNAAEMVPILKPLVPMPGSVAGLQTQLVVRTTPRNMEEIKDVIARLDRAPANLLVTVRHTINDAVRRDLATTELELRSGAVRLTTGASRRAENGPTLQARVRILGTRRRESDSDDQILRVLEGREGYIRAGQAVPVADRRLVVTATGPRVEEGVRYLDVSRGFWVRARLNGERVTVAIAPRRAALSTAGGGVIERRGAATTVSGRLGRWMRIGAVEQHRNRAARSLGGATRAHLNSDYALYLKVTRVH